MNKNFVKNKHCVQERCYSYMPCIFVTHTRIIIKKFFKIIYSYFQYIKSLHSFLNLPCNFEFVIKNFFKNFYFRYKNFILTQLTIVFLIFNSVFLLYSQSDYLRENQYKKFYKNRIFVANWQIHQLADSGALVVRLKSNKKTIDILLKNNQIKQAKELQQTTFELNKKIVLAFANNYHFSPLYFIYDYSSDSLLKGYRNTIFLDTTLQRNATIFMKEKFYLIAEQDYAVQSSIGFVPDSIASKITETGTPVKRMAIVIKNKYGHQLKRPFPYYVKGTNPNKYNLYVQVLQKKLENYKKDNPKMIYPSEVQPYLY